mgnify:FL=1
MLHVAYSLFPVLVEILYFLTHTPNLANQCKILQLKLVIPIKYTILLNMKDLKKWRYKIGHDGSKEEEDL